MYERFLFPSLLGFVIAAGCGGNVVLDSSAGPGGSGSGGSGSGGSGVGGSGGGSPSGGGLTCTETEGTATVCYEYVNLPAGDLSAETSACMAANGTTGTSCPAANALGTCSVSAGGITAMVTYYAGGGLTAATAETACTSAGGTWAAG